MRKWFIKFPKTTKINCQANKKPKMYEYWATFFYYFNWRHVDCKPNKGSKKFISFISRTLILYVFPFNKLNNVYSESSFLCLDFYDWKNEDIYGLTFSIFLPFFYFSMKNQLENFLKIVITILYFYQSFFCYKKTTKMFIL